MPAVRAKENESFEQTLRRFKRSVDEADILNEYRDREFYEKPCLKRKRKHAAAVKRSQRQHQERSLIKTRMY